MLFEKPASDKVLKTLEKEILGRAVKNLHTSIVSFRGSGQSVQLDYLIQNYKDLEIFSKGHIFSFLNGSLLFEEDDKAIKECVSYISNTFQHELDFDARDRLRTIMHEEESVISSLYDVLHYLTKELDKNITLVVPNFRRVYEPNSRSKELVEILLSIIRIYPEKISFVFIAQAEVDDPAKERLGSLFGHFAQNITYGKDILFDAKSFDTLVRINQIGGRKFNESFVEAIKNITFGDPSIAKYFVKKALGDKEFEKDISDNFTNIKKVYSICDQESLEQRYKRIVSGMSSVSLKALLDNNIKPTEYLMQTGLLNQKGDYLNPLLQHYLETNKIALLDINVDIIESKASFRADLSAQELIVFDLLEAKVETIVTKDDVAKAIWGDEWEDSYSDWAIDKLISNLRKKLKEAGYPKTIKAFKGKGVMLT